MVVVISPVVANTTVHIIPIARAARRRSARVRISRGAPLRASAAFCYNANDFERRKPGR